MSSLTRKGSVKREQVVPISDENGNFCGCGSVWKPISRRFSNAPSTAPFKNGFGEFSLNVFM